MAALQDSLGLSLQDELELAKSLAADRLQEVAVLRAQKEALVKQVDKYRIEVRRSARALPFSASTAPLTRTELPLEMPLWERRS